MTDRQEKGSMDEMEEDWEPQRLILRWDMEYSLEWQLLCSECGGEIKRFNDPIGHVIICEACPYQVQMEFPHGDDTRGMIREIWWAREDTTYQMTYRLGVRRVDKRRGRDPGRFNPWNEQGGGVYSYSYVSPSPQLPMGFNEMRRWVECASLLG